MNQSESLLFVFVERSLAEGKKADEDGYYVYSKNELVEGSGVSPSAISKSMPEVIKSLLLEEKGWLPGSDEAVTMLSDISYIRGVFKFRRNPEALSPELDYYWAPHPIYSWYSYKCYDNRQRRRYNGSEAQYGTFPWSWTEEQVVEAYEQWMSCDRITNTYSYANSGKKDPEQERIASIRINGGTHLKNFKPENKTYAMCLVAVELDGEALWFVPAEYKTKEIYEAAVKKTGRMLQRVPDKFITKEMCENAVKSDGLALEYVPEKFKTADVCLFAAIQNPLAMQRMPEELVTVSFVADVIKKYRNGIEAVVSLPKSLKNTKFYLPLVEICPEVIWKLPKAAHTAALSKTCLKAMKCKTLAEAVKENPEFLSQVHPSLYDHDACIAFVTSDFFIEGVEKKDHIGSYSGFNTISDSDKGLFYMNRNYDSPYSIPHMTKWPDVCLALVTGSSRFVKYVKPEMLTAEMCTRAVEASPYGYIIEDIPMEFRTKELCMQAFSKDPYNIQYFPDEYITQDLVVQAVKHSGFVLGHIADKYKTKEVCLIAVSDDGSGKLEEVPDDVIDKDICLAWIKGQEWAVCPLDHIPDKLKDYDIYYACVSIDGSELKKVPVEYVDGPMCLAAAKSDSVAAKYIPQELFTKEMAEAMTERSFVGFEDIPKHALTEKACINALSQSSNCSGRILAAIPDELITQEMCDIAVQQHTWGLKAVPERFVTEEMLISVAKRACGVLTDNFPVRFRTKEFIDKLTTIVPGSDKYVRKYI